jgi:hypothetical protein
MSSLEEAKKVLADLDAKIAERKALLEREEALIAERMISGKAEVKTPEPVISHDEEVRARCNKLLDGTGLQI